MKSVSVATDSYDKGSQTGSRYEDKPSNQTAANLEHVFSFGLSNSNYWHSYKCVCLFFTWEPWS